jgi:hypothetical protein
MLGVTMLRVVNKLQRNHVVHHATYLARGVFYNLIFYTQQLQMYKGQLSVANVLHNPGACIAKLITAVINFFP